MALFTHLCISVHPHPAHTGTQKKVDSWITGPCFSSFPSYLSQPLPFVMKEGNTFSVGLFVYWFPPLFGELGTKTEFILSWPPALSLNTPYLSFSSYARILSAWMSRLHMLPFWMSSLVNQGLIYCVSVELSRIFFLFFFFVGLSQWWFTLSPRES